MQEPLLGQAKKRFGLEAEKENEIGWQTNKSIVIFHVTTADTRLLHILLMGHTLSFSSINVVKKALKDLMIVTTATIEIYDIGVFFI